MSLHGVLANIPTVTCTSIQLVVATSTQTKERIQESVQREYEVILGGLSRHAF